MGAAARRLADHVIVTSDNPRSEDPDAIIAAIVEGAERRRGRGGALDARGRARPPRGDRSARSRSREPRRHRVIAGKGHEQGQEFEGGRKIPFDDRDVAREELRAPQHASVRHRRVIDLHRQSGSRRSAVRRCLRARRARRRRRHARARGRRLARGRDRATCSSALPGERADGGEFAAAGDRGRRLGRARRAGARAGRGRERPSRRARVRRRRPARRARAARARAWLDRPARERLQGRRHHRLDRQDLDQGHPARAARAGASTGRCTRARDNYNTEIGLPLTVLEAERGTRALVLEMAMRGPGTDQASCARSRIPTSA